MTQVDSLVPAAHHPNFVVPILDPSRSARKMSRSQTKAGAFKHQTGFQNTEAVQRVPALQAWSCGTGSHPERQHIAAPARTASSPRAGSSS